MKLLSIGVLSLSSVLVLGASSAMAGDAAAGKEKAQSCVSCHGMAGRSTNPNNPNLAGQKKNYLVKALNDYKSKKRTDAMMNTLAAGLSDADIENIAEYYSTVK